MALDDLFWGHELEGLGPPIPNRKQRLREAAEIALADLHAPLQLVMDKTEQRELLNRLAQTTQQAFPGASIRRLRENAGVGLTAQVGHDQVTVKVLPDSLGQPRFRSFLLAGDTPLTRGGAPSRTVTQQIGSGDHRHIQGYFTWLSWARHMLLKAELLKMALGIIPDNCLSRDKVSPTLRSIWTMVQAGITEEEVRPLLPHPTYNWRPQGTGTAVAATIYRTAQLVNGGQTTLVAGAIAVDQRGDSWRAGGKLAINSLNLPQVQEDELRFQRETPAATLPADPVVAQAAMTRKAEDLFQGMVLSFLWKYQGLRELRELDATP